MSLTLQEAAFNQGVDTLPTYTCNSSVGNEIFLRATQRAVDRSMLDITMKVRKRTEITAAKKF